MKHYTFSQIKTKVFEWFQKEAIKLLADQDEFELSKNDEKVLLINFTFNSCLAQLTVYDPAFAPYQFVSFEAMTLDSKKAQDSGSPEMIYFFYDSPKTTKMEVINELERGIRCCSSYIPNRLSEIYLYKKGTLVMEKKNLHNIIHPDDIKEVNCKVLGKEFICEGTEAQYLFVKNKDFSLRILPQAFNVIL